MRKVLSSALVLVILVLFVPYGFGAESAANQIKAMPAGTLIELRLKNKQHMRGATGALSNAGFMLVESPTIEHQVAFDDIAAVKQLPVKSHRTRNVLIVAGVAVAAVGITAAIVAGCALRCGSHF